MVDAVHLRGDVGDPRNARRRRGNDVRPSRGSLNVDPVMKPKRYGRDLDRSAFMATFIGLAVLVLGIALFARIRALLIPATYLAVLLGTNWRASRRFQAAYWGVLVTAAVGTAAAYTLVGRAPIAQGLLVAIGLILATVWRMRLGRMQT
jgi:hypothetical protein